MAPAPLLQANVPWRRPRAVATTAPPPTALPAALSLAGAPPPPPDPPPPSPFGAFSDELGSFSCIGRAAGRQDQAPPQTPPTLLRLAWARYQRQLRARPLLTKALTAAAIAALSDALAQAVSSSPRPASSSSAVWFRYDPRRTLKMALLGLAWSGPSAHFWQAFLQRLVPPAPPGSGQLATLQNAVQKVVVDQLTYGPVCNLVFMAYTTPPGSLGGRLRRDFAAVQRNGWRVWPLAGLVNYRFVPLEYRVLFVNVVALGWSTYLNVKARS